MKTRTLFLTVFFFCSFSLFAYSIAGIAGPLSPFLTTGSYFQTDNDVFGSALVDEWDDLRTYGFRWGLIIDNRFLVETGYDGLTFRGFGPNSDSPVKEYAFEESSSRTDYCYLSAGYRFVFPKEPDTASFFRFTSTNGAGISVWGRLGGMELQKEWHSVIGVERPVPEQYDSHSTAYPFFYSKLSLFASLPVAVEFSLGGIAYSTFDFTGMAEIVFWIVDRDIAFSLGPQIRLSSDYSFSPTMSQVASFEEGLWIQASVNAGFLFYENRYNLETHVSSGTVGFTLGEKNPVTIPRSHRNTPDKGKITALFGRQFPDNLTTVSAILQPKFIHRAGWFGKRLSFQVTYETGEEKAETDPSCKLRTQYIAGGLSLSLFPEKHGFFLSPIIVGTIGWHAQNRYDRTPFRSGPQTTLHRLVHSGGAGIALRFHPPFPENRSIHYGLTMTGNYRVSLIGAVYRPRFFCTAGITVSSIPPDW